MRRAPSVPLAAVALLLAGVFLTGCVTSKKYRMAKEDTPPARPLDWQVASPPVELTLRAVIVFKGPGSWKREARWDEYLVRMANRGELPVTIESVRLVDILGQPQVPGTDPWQLEKMSYTNWDRYGKTGLKVAAGAGAVALYGGAVYATSAGALMSGGATAGGAVALNIIPVVALLDITAVAIMNHNNKAKVQAEFDRRRLPLPPVVAPGSTVEGSWFFPMTPGPQRLEIKGRAGKVPVELILDLQPLAGLHLQPAGKQ